MIGDARGDLALKEVSSARPYLLFCSSWTKRLITAKDHASVQINVGDVDPATGRYTGTFKTFALCGYIRDKVRRGHCVR